MTHENERPHPVIGPHPQAPGAKVAGAVIGMFLLAGLLSVAVLSVVAFGMGLSDALERNECRSDSIASWTPPYVIACEFFVRRGTP